MNWKRVPRIKQYWRGDPSEGWSLVVQFGCNSLSWKNSHIPHRHSYHCQWSEAGSWRTSRWHQWNSVGSPCGWGPFDSPGSWWDSLGSCCRQRREWEDAVQLIGKLHGALVGLWTSCRVGAGGKGPWGTQERCPCGMLAWRQEQCWGTCRTAAPEVLRPHGALPDSLAPQEPVGRGAQQKEWENSLPSSVSLLCPQLAKLNFGPAGQEELSVSQAGPFGAEKQYTANWQPLHISNTVYVRLPKLGVL